MVASLFSYVVNVVVVGTVAITAAVAAIAFVVVFETTPK